MMKGKPSKMAKEFKELVMESMEEAYKVDEVDSDEAAMLMLREVPGVLVAVIISVIKVAMAAGALGPKTALRFTKVASETMTDAILGNDNKLLSSAEEFEDVDGLEIGIIKDGGKDEKH